MNSIHHPDLLALCQIDFLRSHINTPISDVRANIICTLLRRSIKIGWAQRQIKKRGFIDIAAGMPDYMKCVSNYYETEYAAWLQWQQQDTSTKEALGNLLIQLAHTHVNLQRYHNTVNPDDAASWAYTRVYQRLQNYPFDMALNTWINRFMRQAVEYVRKTNDWELGYTKSKTSKQDDLSRASNTNTQKKQSNGIKNKVESIEDLYERSEATGLQLPEALYDELHEEKQAVLLYVQQHTETLKPDQRQLLTLWIDGFETHEIAEIFGISNRAVYGRLTTILKPLRDDNNTLKLL